MSRLCTFWLWISRKCWQIGKCYYCNQYNFKYFLLNCIVCTHLSLTSFWLLNRDLGVQLQADLSVADQVSKVIHSCYYNVIQLRTIRSSLTPDALYNAVNTLILSQLYYYNALFLNAPMCKLHRLQMLINTTAWVVFGCFRFDHLKMAQGSMAEGTRVQQGRSPHRLLWKMCCTSCQSQRVQFMVCTLVCMAIHGLAPTYISDLVVKSMIIPPAPTLWLAIISTFTSDSWYTSLTLQNMLLWLWVLCYGICYLIWFVTRHL